MNPPRKEDNNVSTTPEKVKNKMRTTTNLKSITADSLFETTVSKNKLVIKDIKYNK